MTRITSDYKFGSASLQFIPSVQYSGVLITANATALTTYTASIWINRLATSDAIVMYLFNGSDATTISSTTVPAVTGWQKVKVTGAPKAGETTVKISIQNNTASPSNEVHIDGVQLETGSIATPYVETNGGTAARSAARVQAPSSLINATQGWVAIRWRPGFTALPNGAPAFFTFADNASNQIQLRYVTTTNLQFFENNGVTTDNGGAVGTAIATGVNRTEIGKWIPGNFGTSINGGAFAMKGSRVTPPTIASATIDLGTADSASANRHLTGDILWFAAGTGTLTDADASTINGYGNTDPTLGSLPSGANTTLIWSADTSTYTAGSVARDTSTTYSSSAGSAKVISSQTTGNFTQSVNVGDTNTYTLSAYAYTDGSAVTSSDLSLLYNGSTITTTYTSVGSGWYKLTGTLTGANAARTYGVQVASGKTVYVDNFSLNRYAASGTLTSSIFDAENTNEGSNWGTLTYSAITPSNTSVSVAARTSNSSSMTGATAFGSCTAITSGSDISSNSCVTDGHRYIQYQVALSTTDTASSTPTFQDISIAFSQRDVTGPVSIDLDSPGDNSYTNNERPTFKWKATTDATAGLSKYVLEIDNPSIGSSQPSGDFTIDNIPTSGTTDVTNNKYTIHYENFSDSDSTNNYISVYTKSHSDWGTSENDGKLREGKVSWKVKAVDNAGNETSGSRTLFVDRTNPNVEFTQINSTPYTSNNFSTTDKTPTIFGKITDPLAGGDSSQTQDENGPRVASGPKEVNIKVEQKQGLTYKLVTLYKINMDNPYYTCDPGKIIDNSKQKCDKYLPFEYTPEQNLDLGTYKITISGKDKADNSSGETAFTLNITTFAQITTAEEKATIEEETQELKPEEKQKIQETLEITKPIEPNVIEKAVGATGSFISAIFGGIGNGIKFVANGIGSGLAFVFDKTGQGLAFIFNKTGEALAFVFDKTGQGLAFVGNGIGNGYNNIAQHAPGFTKNILIAIGNGFGAAGNFIGTLANNMGTGIHNMGSAIAQGFNNTVNGAKNGIASLAFALGEKTDDVSHGLGTTIIKIGYLFVPEPTKIYDVQVATLSPTSAKITWHTNHPANGKVNYGLDETYPLDIQTDKRTAYHEFTLTNLKPDTQYYFEVMSQNRNYVYDANRKFKTPK